MQNLRQNIEQEMTAVSRSAGRSGLPTVVGDRHETGIRGRLRKESYSSTSCECTPLGALWDKSRQRSASYTRQSEELLAVRDHFGKTAQLNPLSTALTPDIRFKDCSTGFEESCSGLNAPARRRERT
jgi:hypothetical protein